MVRRENRQNASLYKTLRSWNLEFSCTLCMQRIPYTKTISCYGLEHGQDLNKMICDITATCNGGARAQTNRRT